MRTTYSTQSKRVLTGLLSIALMSMSSGCTPFGSGELGEFAHDLFLNALAAFLL